MPMYSPHAWRYWNIYIRHLPWSRYRYFSWCSSPDYFVPHIAVPHTMPGALSHYAQLSAISFPRVIALHFLRLRAQDEDFTSRSQWSYRPAGILLALYRFRSSSRRNCTEAFIYRFSTKLFIWFSKKLAEARKSALRCIAAKHLHDEF